MLTNAELADELRTLANLLLIDGSHDYRARRFLRLADTVDGLGETVEILHAESRLTDVEGVGESTAAIISDFLESGTTALRRQVGKRVPLTALDLLQIAGVGPKTAQRLFHELGITGVDALDEALAHGSVAALNGLSAKSEEKMREGIARVRRRNVERPLQEVLRIGEQIGETLNLVPEMSAIAAAGEARRAHELPRRVHLVAATENIGRASVVLQRIGLGDGAPTRIVRGEFGGGFPVKVVLAPSNCFGVTWLCETADRAHLEALEARAERRGLPALTDENAWARMDEAAVYDKLGLPPIPAEVREGTESIVRADAGALPRFVGQEDYRGDLHCHTQASDGHASLEEMAQAAVERGHEYLGICDHSRSAAYANGLTIDRLRRQGDAIRELNEHLVGRLTVLAGSEVDILPNGELDFADDVLAELDWVVASVHSGFTLSEQDQTARICRAMENRHVQVVGHATGRLLGIRDPYAVDVPALITKAAETGVALELNAAPDRLDLGAEYCRQARESGVTISINTDAHRVEGLDSIRYGLAVARRAWLEPQHVLNTWDLDQVLEFRRPDSAD